jgi:hypothetical protein
MCPPTAIHEAAMTRPETLENGMRKIELLRVVTPIIATAMIAGTTPSFAFGVFAGAPSFPGMFSYSQPDQASTKRDKAVPPDRSQVVPRVTQQRCDVLVDPHCTPNTARDPD